ncbi:MAG: hypothetical protein AAGE61_13065 [Pseudomonadota bacterium]
MSSLATATEFAAAQLQPTLSANAIRNEQAQVAGLLQIIEESQARIEAAQAAPPPTLDGTGSVVDRSA